MGYQNIVDQISYLNGKEVPYATPGSTRPDLFAWFKKKKYAIEVKNYDLRKKTSFEALIQELRRQFTERAEHLPEDVGQRLALDVRGRQFSKSDIQGYVEAIRSRLSDVISDLPIDIIQ